MSGKSYLLYKQAQIKEDAYRTAERITRQYDTDTLQIALSRYPKLNLGYDRIMEICELWESVQDEYINAYSDMPDYEQKIKGTYISDEALVDEVIEALKDKRPDEKIFYMTATIQTHMPFDKDVYDGYDINVESTKLSEEDTGIILSYAQGVYDTNIQIQRLYEEIQKIEEPTIIVALGDHLPYLYNSDGEDVLAKLSYFNTGDEKVDLLRKYSTEALVLSNYGAKIDFGSEYISPDMLLTNIINQMDIEISPYYKWLYNIRNILPAQNQYITLDTRGNIYYANEEMMDTIQKTKILRENIQYYLFESN